MADRPTVFPEWATDDVQDPVSQQFNVVEPPTEKKMDGWFLGEKPNRQWWNWLHRQTYLWLEFLDGMFGGSATSQTLIPTWAGFTVQPFVNFFYYSVIGDKCFFNGNIQWASNVDTTTVVQMTNLPFVAKNVNSYLQCIQLERGSVATSPNGKTLYANLNANTTNLIFRETDLTTGISIDTVDQGAAGTLRFSGFYVLEPV